VSDSPFSATHLRRVWPPLAVVGVLVLLVALVLQLPSTRAHSALSMLSAPQQDRPAVAAPELNGGDWLNTAGPLRLADLRGKVVLLDFWTYCCINCIHILPDLEKLEKKYANELVVIGVHSAKFQAEKETKNIREAILRYNIEHPVVNDADHKIWNAYGANSWPTFWLIDPEGNLVGHISGEGHFETLDKVIGIVVEKHRQKKTLKATPIRISLERDKVKMARSWSSLHFPGNVIADVPANRLFIADSSNHRIVITDLAGKQVDVIGTGMSGTEDGPFEKAQFNDPQGMAVRGPTLFVADRKNHLIRAVNLKDRVVTTIAGMGKQGRDREGGGPAKTTGLNSPWDVLLVNDHLYIAMAGHHQIWRMNLADGMIGQYAGNGMEDIIDGSLDGSSFAQPSGLATDGTFLYVADSEVSAIRAVPLEKGKEVKTIVGRGLFDYGDKDGTGEQVRLQHALGVAVWQSNLLVADTYNNKIKLIDPRTRQTLTFLGDGQPGREDLAARFNEPGGIHVAGDQAYVADTNNHAIRVIDLKKRSVRTLALTGVMPPVPPVSKPGFRNLISVALPEMTLKSSDEVQVQVKINLMPGFKLDPAAPLGYLVEAFDGEKKVIYETYGELVGTTTLKVPVAKVQMAKKLKVSVEYYPCSAGQGICQVKSQSWEIPVQFNAKTGAATLTLETRSQ
jgi:thiol-disulfide isomerase/thioredoxin